MIEESLEKTDMNEHGTGRENRKDSMNLGCLGQKEKVTTVRQHMY